MLLRNKLAGCVPLLATAVLSSLLLDVRHVILDTIYNTESAKLTVLLDSLKIQEIAI